MDMDIHMAQYSFSYLHPSKHTTGFLTGAMPQVCEMEWNTQM